MSRGHQTREGDWRGWQDYMGEKQRKLGEQYKDENKEQKSDMFKGVAIFVNGWTDPPVDVLRLRMQQHGGRHHMYKTHSTTHTIATQLAKSKLDKVKPGDKVVRPEWITDSIAAGQLLDDTPYRLVPPATSASGGISKFTTPLTTAVESTSTDAKSLPATAATSSAGVSSSLASHSYLPDHTALTAASSSSPRPAASADASDQPKTATDPSFLSDFYGKSRLHHISMWAQQMKRLVAEIRQTSDASFPNLQRIKSDPTFVPPQPPVYMHIDMDCFFVSVVLTRHPEHRGKPVVITHSKGVGPSSSAADAVGSFSSYAEIASCSYEARRFGLRNGMLLGKAKRLCPDLFPLMYDFDGYNRVSRTLYEIVCGYTHEVQAVSCDEMFVCLTSVCESCAAPPLAVARAIRQHIREQTDCPVSAGLGPNLLVARLATRQAKPDGQTHITEAEIDQFMKAQKIADLPGIGHSTLAKLEATFGDQLSSCAQLQRVQAATLMQTFGQKTGQTLYDACRGVDHRRINVDTNATQKTVSCDVNYGIRFKTDDEAATFLTQLSAEVSRKIRAINMHAKHITLRLLVRSADAPIEPAKFMGHGVCDAASKSVSLMVSTDDATTIALNAHKLYQQLKPPVTDIRGVSIGLHKLLSMEESAKQQRACGMRPLESFFAKQPSPTKARPPAQNSEAPIDSAVEVKTTTPVVPVVEEVEDEMLQHEEDCWPDAAIAAELPFELQQQMDDELSSAAASTVDDNSRPPQIDPEVLQHLPADICAELIDYYGGSASTPATGTSHPVKPIASTSTTSKKPLSVGRGKHKSGSWTSSTKKSPAKKQQPRKREPTTFPDDLSLTQCWGQPSKRTLAADTVVPDDVVLRDVAAAVDEDKEQDEPAVDTETLNKTILSLIQADAEVDEFAASHMRAYVVGLVRAGGQLDALCRLLSQIKRCVRPEQQQWHSWFATVMQQVQDEVRQLYGHNVNLAV